MSDKTSAEIFGLIFNLLAKQPKSNQKLAAKIWKISSQYDFHPCQMGCNDALKKLGLAVISSVSSDNQDIEIIYADCDIEF